MRLLRRRDRFDALAPEEAVDLAYQVMLRRDPRPGDRVASLSWLRAGRWSNRDLVYFLRSSSEFDRHVRFPGRMLGHSLYASRCHFVRSLPPAARILDLGSTHAGQPEGAIVAMGYPYRFEALTVVDRPSGDGVELRQQQGRPDRVETALGPVTYRYHALGDLDGYPDASMDLVYAGRAVDRLAPDEGRHVLSELRRILRPGAHLGVVTPNARVCELQPDGPAASYRLGDVRGAIESAGLAVVDVKGANYCGRSLEAGAFDPDEAAGNSGLYWDAGACYLLCLVAEKGSRA